MAHVAFSIACAGDYKLIFKPMLYQKVRGDDNVVYLTKAAGATFNEGDPLVFNGSGAVVKAGGSPSTTPTQDNFAGFAGMTVASGTPEAADSFEVPVVRSGSSDTVFLAEVEGIMNANMVGKLVTTGGTIGKLGTIETVNAPFRVVRVLDSGARAEIIVVSN